MYQSRSSLRSSFIQSNFSIRKCKRYVQVDLAKEPQRCGPVFLDTDCVCGRSKQWHVQQLLPIDEMPRQNITLPEMRRAFFRRRSDEEQTDAPPSSELMSLPPNFANTLPPPWSLENDTQLYQCDTFGEIVFRPGHNVEPRSIAHNATAKYIRLQGLLHNDQYKENVYKLMTEHWRMPTPQLIIEVTGAARNLPHVDRRVVEAFNQGLIQAAKSANAWLVTGGTNGGVMKLVGDAVTRHHMSHGESRITCLGIVSWGIVDNRDVLVVDDDRTIDRQRDYFVNQGVETGGGYSSLDPGHNYFLLVDNGLEKRFGEEINFRAELTAFLTHKHLSTSTDCSKRNLTPLVLLVIGGGKNTLTTVELSVGGQVGQEACMKRPVVVLPGFGGAADVLAHAYELGTDDEPICEDFDDKIRRHPALKRLLGDRDINNPTAVNQTLATLKRCLADRKLLTVVNMFESKTAATNEALDEAILRAIFKAKDQDVEALMSLFNLAQHWNQHQIAEWILNKIYHENQVMKHEYINPKACMNQSLLAGQHKFFELLLEFNMIDLGSYFTREHMLELYMAIFINRNAKASRSCVSFFSSLLLKNTSADELAERSAKSRRFLAKRIGDALSSILRCTLANPFQEDSNSKTNQLAAVQSLPLTSSIRSSRISRRGSLVKPDSSPYLQTKDYPMKMRDLFLFNLLLKRNRFAELVWRDSTEHLGTSLMGAIFLRSLGNHASRLDMHDLAEDYRRLADVWLERTIAMLTRSYDTKPEQTLRMLVRSLQMWQGKTTLELAFYGNEKAFIAHTAVQAKLNQVWFGRIASFTSPWLVCGIALFPYLLWPSIFKLQFTPSDPADVRSQPLEIDHHQQKEDSSSIAGDVDDGARKRLQSSSNDSLDSDEETKRPVLLKNEAILLEPYIFYAWRSRTKLPRNAISSLTAAAFIYSSPMVKLMFSALAMLLFLLLFTYFILTSFAEPISAVEIVIWVWAFCFFMEEVHSHITRETMAFNQIRRSFFSDSAGIVTSFAEALMIVSIVLRCALPMEYYVLPHTTYSLSCLVFWVNSMRFWYVAEELGPKVTTLFKMFQELVFFLAIYLVLLFAFSVSIHALLSPRENITNVGDFFTVLLLVLYARWWNLAGVGLDASREDVEGVSFNETEVANSSGAFLTHLLVRSDVTGKHYHVVAVLLLIIYIFLTNIMLLNMLIAMLSMKVEEVRQDASRLWRFSYYRIVTCYYNKLLLPAPFNILPIFYDCFLFMLRRYRGKTSRRLNTELKVYLDASGPEYTKLDLIEQNVMAQVWQCDDGTETITNQRFDEASEFR